MPVFGSICPRLLVFAVASLSFGCLLGQFYGAWTMRWFGCWVLPRLVRWRSLPGWGEGKAHSAGSCGRGLRSVPAAVRAAGAPLFAVFPRFGELLLESPEPRWAVQALGWGYYFSNGAALGVMFLALVTQPTPRVLVWGAVAWALFVEAMLLLTPYAPFFGLPWNGQFIALTASAHLVFGVALGLWCRHRVSEPLPLPPDQAR